LLVIAIVVVVVLLMKSAARRGELPKTGEAKVEDMVRCHVCGVNLPRSEAILSRGRFYCGEEHRRQNEA
jgi:uncharacterized protein